MWVARPLLSFLFCFLSGSTNQRALEAANKNEKKPSQIVWPVHFCKQGTRIFMCPLYMKKFSPAAIMYRQTHNLKNWIIVRNQKKMACFSIKYKCLNYILKYIYINIFTLLSSIERVDWSKTAVQVSSSSVDSESPKLARKFTGDIRLAAWGDWDRIRTIGFAFRLFYKKYKFTKKSKLIVLKVDKKRIRAFIKCKFFQKFFFFSN